MKIIRILIFCLLLPFLTSCEDKVQSTIDEVEGWIAAELKIGASVEEIEAFFYRHDILVSFNKSRMSPEEIEAFYRKHDINPDNRRLESHYNAIIRNVTPKALIKAAVGIRIYVDEEKKFTRSEVKASYTSI